MAVPKSRLLANSRYQDKAYDKTTIALKKGKLDFYKTEAQKRKISFVELIQVGVEEYIKNHVPNE